MRKLQSFAKIGWHFMQCIGTHREAILKPMTMPAKSVNNNLIPISIQLGLSGICIGKVSIGNHASIKLEIDPS
jgi:hypothetical protein